MMTSRQYWNNRQVRINVGTALVAIFRISFLAKKDLWFHAEFIVMPCKQIDSVLPVKFQRRECFSRLKVFTFKLPLNCILFPVY